MLSKQSLISGFENAASQAEANTEKAKKEIKKLKADVGQSLTHEQFQDAAAEIGEKQLGNQNERMIGRMAQAVADYLNGMVDPTGDGLMTPFSKSDTRPLIKALKQPSPEAVAVPPVDAQVQSVWASFFPLTFKTTTPPPGSIKKVSSLGAPTPIGSMAPVITGNKSYEDAIRILANIIHTSASSIVVTIQHTISTPSGPAPGPPIVSKVQ